MSKHTHRRLQRISPPGGEEFSAQPFCFQHTSDSPNLLNLTGAAVWPLQVALALQHLREGRHRGHVYVQVTPPNQPAHTQLFLHMNPLDTKQVCRGTRLPAGTPEPQLVTTHPQCIVVAPHHQERVNERGERVSCLSNNSNVTAGAPGGFRTSRTPTRGTGRTTKRGMPPGRGRMRGQIPTRRATTTEPTAEIGLTGGRRERRHCKSSSGSGDNGGEGEGARECVYEKNELLLCMRVCSKTTCALHPTPCTPHPSTRRRARSRSLSQRCFTQGSAFSYVRYL